jgi:precorrin-6Y C5,15-methyltransferase (decarboxylating)
MSRFTQPGIHVIGLGVAERAHLVTHAELALTDAEVVIGSERQLETVRRLLDIPFHEVVKIELPPLKELAVLLDHHAGKRIAILASGDPLYYGIGRWLSKRYSFDEISFYPAVSSIQAACHSIGLSLQDAEVVSLHGRPLVTLRRYLAQHQNLVILTDRHSTPQALALECQLAGFDESTIWVCEKLGYQEQQVRKFAVSELIDNENNASLIFDPLHVTIIQVKGQSKYLPTFPGIPDAHFITDAEAGKGLITKREVRLAILSLLQAAPGDVGWDIGAGCGGVAVEWALWNPLGQVHAIEHHDARLRCLGENRDRFGVVNNLNIVSGRAPEVLSELPAANKIFIGGSDGELSKLLGLLWDALPNDGVVVASAVMESTRSCLIEFSENLRLNEQSNGHVETLQVAVSRGGELAGQLLYRPALPVTLFKFTKHNYLAKDTTHDASK